jgi:probable addiction module antidote protein
MKFDAAEYLDSEEAIAAYLSDALASGDGAQIGQALGTVARVKGMAGIARKAKLGRQSLYKALSPDGNPSFDTVLRVIDALGVQLSAEARAMPGRRSVKRQTSGRMPRRQAAREAAVR